MNASRLIPLVLTLGLLTAAAGCGERPRDQIVGTWQFSGKGVGFEVKFTAEFTDTGTVKQTLIVPGQVHKVVEGKYQLLPDDAGGTLLEVQVTEEGKQKTERSRIEKLTADRLVITGEHGEKRELARVK